MPLTKRNSWVGSKNGWSFISLAPRLSLRLCGFDLLRLVMTLENGPDGATGKLVSLDQNNFEMPVVSIAETGSRVKLTMPMVSGAYDAELKGGELTGTWTQGALSLPLVLKKRP